MISINENGGGLNFSISLNLDLLGADSDLHVFYFNIVGEISGLAIATTDAPVSDYMLTQNPPVAGGAGSNFDWGVDFGNGGGASGNGKLQSASFTLTADQNLVLDDLLESSFASGGSIEVQFAAHIQGTSALTGASSETIGGTIPEPSTGALVCWSLALLAVRSRRAGRSRTSTR